MIGIESRKLFIVFCLKPEEFKPLTKIRGPISLEPVTMDNIPDVSINFASGKIPVFYEKLEHGHVGVFARYKSDVVGYMWYKDYDPAKPVKADGYIPLTGPFSHIHFAQVSREMRGRGIQLLMLTYLIRDLYKRGRSRIFTDTQQKNIVSISGIMKTGFREAFRLVVIRAFGRNFPIIYQGERDPMSGQDSTHEIIRGKMRWMASRYIKKIAPDNRNYLPEKDVLNIRHDEIR
jgi:GNAT superfamily N-acetyltransferase